MQATTVEKLIKQLNMLPHPEGGYFAEVYRSSETIKAESLPERFTGDRQLGTQIYYLLNGKNFSAFHRIKGDEIWHYYAGNTTLVVHEITTDGKYIEHKLGSNLDNGEKFISVIQHQSWFASEVLEKDDDKFALVGCTVVPGFDFADFEMAERESLLKERPEYKDLITRMTRVEEKKE